MANTRLTLVVRKDLQLPIGLFGSQVAHIADQFSRKRIVEAAYDTEVDIPYKDPKVLVSDIFSKEDIHWMKDPYLSLLAVYCHEDLVAVMDHAAKEGLQVLGWHDTIPSPTFPDRAIKVLVGCSIGPDDFDKIKVVCGGLPLYE